MDRRTTLDRILGTGVIAVVRLRSPDGLVRLTAAIEAGGVDAIEFTMTTPGALESLAVASAELGERVLLGAGTVLDAATAHAAVGAGARFIVAPTMSVAMIETARRLDAVAIPGAFTPTEILAAWDAGADLVKVFPATGLGPRYFRDVLAPLPGVRLVPSGGVDLATAGPFIEAGAAAISVGGQLVDPGLVARHDWDGLTSLARSYREAVSAARAAMASAHRT